MQPIYLLHYFALTLAFNVEIILQHYANDTNAVPTNTCCICCIRHLQQTKWKWLFWISAHVFLPDMIGLWVRLIWYIAINVLCLLWKHHEHVCKYIWYYILFHFTSVCLSLFINMQYWSKRVRGILQALYPIVFPFEPFHFCDSALSINVKLCSRHPPEGTHQYEWALTSIEGKCKHRLNLDSWDGGPDNLRIYKL